MPCEDSTELFRQRSLCGGLCIVPTTCDFFCRPLWIVSISFSAPMKLGQGPVFGEWRGSVKEQEEARLQKG